MSASALSARGCTAPPASGVVAPFRLQNFGQMRNKCRVISLSIQAKLYFPYIFRFFKKFFIPNFKIESFISLVFLKYFVCKAAKMERKYVEMYVFKT
jgi:hypothetical protein